MYKVFVNDKPIILSDQVAPDLAYEFSLLSDISIEEVIHKLRHTQATGYYIYDRDLTYLWKQFQANFEVVKAAGGLVLKDKKALMIYRNDCWDLPKGKWENGETLKQTALREVEEECGVTNLNIEKPLDETLHIFYENNRNKLKITSWYLMHTTDNIVPIPQKEEGISKAVYTPISDIPELYDSMYANICNLLKIFFKTHNI